MPNVIEQSNGESGFMGVVYPFFIFKFYPIYLNFPESFIFF